MFKDSLHKAFLILFSFDSELYGIVLTSISVAFYSVLCSAFFGILIAFYFDNASPIVNKTGRAILNSLMAVPTVVIGLLVYGVLSRSGLFGGFGILYTQLAIIIGQSILVTPVIASSILSGFSALDNTLSETLTTFGVTGIKYLFAYINETKIIIATSLLSGFGRVIGEVGISMMLGGNIRYYTRTMTTAIALETNKGDFATSLALGIILILLALSINFLIHFLIPNSKKSGRL